MNNPVSDAEYLAGELAEHYGFDTLIFRNPTLKEIIAQLRKYAAKDYFEDSQLLVFFSGHGYFDELSREGFFVPIDGFLSDSSGTTYLPHSRLEGILDRMPCRHLLVIIDACFSGTFDQSLAVERGAADGIKRANSPSRYQKYIETRMGYRSRLYLTSGGKEKTLDGERYSPLTEKILNALRSHPLRKDILAFEELIGYVQDLDPLPRSGQFGRHQPGGSFLFFFQPEEYDETGREDQPSSGPPQGLTRASGGQQERPAGIDPAAIERDQAESEDWQKIRSNPTVGQVRKFILDYPQGLYSERARQLLNNLEKEVPDMIMVRGGTYLMGCAAAGRGGCNRDEQPVRNVRLDDFYLGRFEVTFEEFDAYCNSTGRNMPYDEGWGRGSHPVVNVSWEEALRYCNWRSQVEGLEEVFSFQNGKVTANWEANGYRLPTEAEWEYAAKGSSNQWMQMRSPEQITGLGNFSGQDDGFEFTAPVGKFRPNGLGLHDLSGNVWEWCWDLKTEYPTTADENPRGPESGIFRAARGGSWDNMPDYFRPTIRYGLDPNTRLGVLGFRLARNAP